MADGRARGVQVAQVALVGGLSYAVNHCLDQPLLVTLLGGMTGSYIASLTQSGVVSCLTRLICEPPPDLRKAMEAALQDAIDCVAEEWWAT